MTTVLKRIVIGLKILGRGGTKAMLVKWSDFFFIVTRINLVASRLWRKKLPWGVKTSPDSATKSPSWKQWPKESFHRRHICSAIMEGLKSKKINEQHGECKFLPEFKMSKPFFVVAVSRRLVIWKGTWANVAWTSDCKLFPLTYTTLFSVMWNYLKVVFVSVKLDFVLATNVSVLQTFFISFYFIALMSLMCHYFW